MYEYKARCIHVVDGDTYDFEIDLGFHIRHAIRVRLAGYDTPELRSSLLAERKHAEEAKQFCERMLLADDSYQIRLRTRKDKKGKYGRYLAEVWLLEPDAGLDGIETAHIGCSLGRMLEEEGLLKRSVYPSNAEKIAEEMFERQAEHRDMAQKRAMEGVMSTEEKTPTG